MFRLIASSLLPIFLLLGEAQAQRFQDRFPDRGNRPQFLLPLTLRSGTSSMDVRAFPNNRCMPEMTLRIAGERQGFFANGQRELMAEWPQILAYVQEKCTETTSLLIEGERRGQIIYKGASRASAGWDLEHTRTPLSAALEDADRQTIRFEDTRQLDGVMQRHSIFFGGTDKPDAAALMARIEERKAKLASEQLEQYSRELQTVPASIAGLDRLETLSASLFRTLEARYAASLPRFREARDSRAREIEVVITNEVDRELNAPVAGWREVLARGGLVQDRQSALTKRIPLINDVAADAVSKLNAALPRFLPEFRDFIAGMGDGWEALRQLEIESQSLARVAILAGGLGPYVEIVAERRNSLLSGIEQSSTQELTALGKSVGDIEAVIDRGEDIAKQLSAFRMTDAAGRIRTVVAERVNALADQGYEAFANGIKQLPASLESRAQLLAIAEEYAALEANVPAFSRYADLAEERAGEIERNVCLAAAAAIGDEALLSQSVSLNQGSQTLRDYVCQVALVGHKLTRTATMWTRLMGVFSSDVTLEFVSASGDTSEITMRPVSNASGVRMLAGYQVKSAEGETRTLTEAAWHTLAAQMIAPPASGKPDQTGRTECDLLAADPDDPKKRAPGVKDDQIDLKAALEACVAGVEHRPSDSVQLYQLGRLLKHGGNEELARHYLEMAAKSDHPAASAKLADLQALHEDQTKLALANYKRAVRGGYEPAKAQLAMLSVGEPIDFAKEPPRSGSFKLLCLLEIGNISNTGQVGDAWLSELKVDVDLDAKTMTFDYEELVSNTDGLKLFKKDKAYSISGDDVNWIVQAENIGEIGTGLDFRIWKRELKIRHSQPLAIKQLFARGPGRLDISGECMQSF